MRPIEEYLADFLLANRGPEFEAYRRRCMELWRERYGEAVARKAWALARGKAEAKSGTRL